MITIDGIDKVSNCPVCNCSAMIEVEEDLRRGTPIGEVAYMHDLSVGSIRYHLRGHKARR
jgi:hypothetical protein